MINIVSLIISAILIVFLGIIFNRFVSNRNHVKDAWSNIDVFLKKRYELIPSLVSVVKGYAKHELQTFEKISEVRSNAMKIPENNIHEKANAEKELSQLINSITIIQESYPDLKADLSFIKLQKQMADIEQDLEKSRRYYNACVRENNTFGESFPASMFRRLLWYKHYDFFSALSHERNINNVDF